ncbi:small RNA-binding protein 11, chloroplastic [Cucurbita pepo subsp. pepo]|uniref:small RNA-binding protein 11, chloroplastic n=1 Tax=Cucurbita pepo subsp. pepo TaxID=3664 RepID=UPI000C9D64D5|nr:small RNA-binding protein 11, chloroplastic [Cucurbita pepo subsp. pepo]
MWAATVSFPSLSNLRGPIPLNNRLDSSKRQSLNLRASFSDYPLASRLMVRNLPYSTNENRLQEEFSNFGEIAEVLLAKDRLTKTPKGYAFIQYTSQDDAMLALENMDCKKFDGRTIYVELAKPGSGSFRGYPVTSGPPKERPIPKLVPEEVADCWY